MSQILFFFFQAEDGIRDVAVTGVQTCALNASTLPGIQPIWSKGKIDRREHLLAEIWNPISKVRAVQPELTDAFLWGPSPRVPRTRVEQIWLDIDNDAATPITRYQGDLATLDFLRYDVTSIGAKLRAGGTAAIIGVGGGRSEEHTSELQSRLHLV